MNIFGKLINSAFELFSLKVSEDLIKEQKILLLDFLSLQKSLTNDTLLAAAASVKTFNERLEEYMSLYSYDARIAFIYGKSLKQSLQSRSLFANNLLEHSIATTSIMLQNTKREANFVFSSMRLICFAQQDFYNSFSNALERGVLIRMFIMNSFENADQIVVSKLKDKFPETFTFVATQNDTPPSADIKSTTELTEFETFDDNMFLLWLKEDTYTSIAAFNDEEKTSNLKKHFNLNEFRLFR